MTYTGEFHALVICSIVNSVQQLSNCQKNLIYFLGFMYMSVCPIAYDHMSNLEIRSVNLIWSLCIHHLNPNLA